MDLGAPLLGIRDTYVDVSVRIEYRRWRLEAYRVGKVWRTALDRWMGGLDGWKDGWMDR